VNVDAGQDRQPPEHAAMHHRVTLIEAFRVWLRVALLSFGGPAGQIAVMHRIIVEEKRWIGENRFLHALNYCMLLPGPEAQQLATYIGWLMHRTLGGIIAGVLFVIPGVISIMLLSIIYALFGNVGIVAALFFGLKAAVLAVVLQAVVRIGSKALKNRVMLALAATAFTAIFFFGVPFPIIVLTAGLIGYFGGRAGLPAFQVGGGHGPTKGKVVADSEALLGEGLPEHARPTLARALRISAVCLILWLAPVAALLATLGSGHVFSQIATFFSTMAVVTFGGAYAVLAYVAQQAVEGYGWLRPGEMLDGLGMAETTPGPLIMVLQFVGFMGAYRDPGALSPMMAGVLGGLLATWVTFVPCFLFIFLGAPFMETLRGNKALHGALSAITAAVVGVVLNLAIWFAVHTIFRETYRVRGFGLSFDAPALASVNVWALMLSLAAVVAMFRLKAGMIPTLAACSAAGVALYRELIGVLGPLVAERTSATAPSARLRRWESAVLRPPSCLPHPTGSMSRSE
jgi:chromate transporter